MPFWSLKVIVITALAKCMSGTCSTALYVRIYDVLKVSAVNNPLPTVESSGQEKTIVQLPCSRISRAGRSIAVRTAYYIT